MEYIGLSQPDLELYHYGVPGMKWGIRHEKKSSSKLSTQHRGTKRELASSKKAPDKAVAREKDAGRSKTSKQSSSGAQKDKKRRRMAALAFMRKMQDQQFMDQMVRTTNDQFMRQQMNWAMHQTMMF